MRHPVGDEAAELGAGEQGKQGQGQHLGPPPGSLPAVVPVAVVDHAQGEDDGQVVEPTVYEQGDEHRQRPPGQPTQVAGAQKLEEAPESHDHGEEGKARRGHRAKLVHQKWRGGQQPHGPRRGVCATQATQHARAQHQSHQPQQQSQQAQPERTLADPVPQMQDEEIRRAVWEKEEIAERDGGTRQIQGLDHVQSGGQGPGQADDGEEENGDQIGLEVVEEMLQGNELAV